jgi:hypothetical protein
VDSEIDLNQFIGNNNGEHGQPRLGGSVQSSQHISKAPSNGVGRTSPTPPRISASRSRVEIRSRSSALPSEI